MAGFESKNRTGETSIQVMEHAERVLEGVEWIVELESMTPP